jgi:septum site-determining protein MinD
MLAASQTRQDALTVDGVEKILTDLAAMDFEYIVLRLARDIETNALIIRHFA